MKRNLGVLLFLVAFFCCVAPAPSIIAQTQPPPATDQERPPSLAPGKPVERELAAGESHEYRLELRANRFVLVTVEQRGIDVILRAYDPQGRTIQQSDSSGKEGLESVGFFNEVKGAHRVEIVPFDKEAEPGRYSIEVARLERAARTASGKVDQLMARWDRADSPGAALAVVQDGKVVYKNGYGSAQLEYGIPITPSTVFHVASVSKQFTAFAVILLAEQGKLSLDDDVRKYIPEVPDLGKPITLRQLIHHTSGLRDQWNLLALAGWRLDDVITREHILTLVEHQQELNFDPGEKYVYCNTGYTLLAEVVARVTGQSFREWTAEMIFKPLGMDRTHFHDDHQMIVPDRAYSYASAASGYRKAVLSYANVGATSLFTTVEDLAKWTDNLDTGILGGESVLRLMHQRGVLNNGEELSYASGLVHGEHRGLRTVGHSGGDAGFRSHVVRYPDQRFAVVVLSNLADFSPYDVARQIAEIYLAEEMDAQDASAKSNGDDEDADEPVEVDVAVLDDYTGEFQLEGGPLITIIRDGQQLVAQTRGRPDVTLHPESETTFLIREADIRVTFHREESGDVARFTLLQGGQELPAKRVERAAPSVEELKQYVGEFYSRELGTFYTIAVEDDRLVALHRRHGKIELTPTTRDEFTGNQWFFGQVKFERNDTHEVIVMLVSSGRVRDVRFERWRGD